MRIHDSLSARVSRGMLAVVFAVVACASGLAFCVLALGGADVDSLEAGGSESGTLHCGTALGVALLGGPTGPGDYFVSSAEQSQRDEVCQTEARSRLLWSIPAGVLAIGALAGLLWSTRGIGAPLPETTVKR